MRDEETGKNTPGTVVQNRPRYFVLDSDHAQKMRRRAADANPMRANGLELTAAYCGNEISKEWKKRDSFCLSMSDESLQPYG